MRCPSAWWVSTGGPFQVIGGADVGPARSQTTGATVGAVVWGTVVVVGDVPAVEVGGTDVGGGGSCAGPAGGFPAAPT